MIAIINETEKLGLGKYGIGIQMYGLYVNNEILFRFEHEYSDGLTECLYRAYQTSNEIDKEKREK
jgi:hypothetical protein